MPHELSVALCLVLVIEGLVLFASPRAWQRMMLQAAQMPPRTLRLFGAGAMAVGWVAFKLVY